MKFDIAAIIFIVILNLHLQIILYRMVQFSETLFKILGYINHVYV